MLSRHFNYRNLNLITTMFSSGSLYDFKFCELGLHLWSARISPGLCGGLGTLWRSSNDDDDLTDWCLKRRSINSPEMRQTCTSPFRHLDFWLMMVRSLTLTLLLSMKEQNVLNTNETYESQRNMLIMSV